MEPISTDGISAPSYMSCEDTNDQAVSVRVLTADELQDNPKMMHRFDITKSIITDRPLFCFSFFFPCSVNGQS